MDIRWLQDFLTIAETANFTRAAEIRNSSQAAFSRRIQSLEQWLGVPLIDRSTFPTKLTARRRAVSRTRRRDRAASGGRQGRRSPGQWSVGASRCASRFLMRSPPAVLASWWAEWSAHGMDDVTCTAVPGNVHDTVTALVGGGISNT